MHISFIYLCSFSTISKVETYGNLGRVPELNSKQFLFVRESCLSMFQEETTLSGVTYLKIQSHFCGSMFFHLRQLIPIRSNFLCDMDIFRLPWKHITTKDLPYDFRYLRTQKCVLPLPYHPGVWYTYSTYKYHKIQPNEGKYAIHGSYGSDILTHGEINGSDFLFQQISHHSCRESQGKPALKLTGWHLPGESPSKRKLISLPRHPFSGATVDGSEIRLTTWDVYVNSGIFTISTGLPYQLVQVPSTVCSFQGRQYTFTRGLLLPSPSTSVVK